MAKGVLCTYPRAGALDFVAIRTPGWRVEGGGWRVEGGGWRECHVHIYEYAVRHTYASLEQRSSRKGVAEGFV